MIDLKKYIETEIENQKSSLYKFCNYKSDMLCEALKNTNEGDWIEDVYVVDLDPLDFYEDGGLETYTYNGVPVMECDKPITKVSHDGLKSTMSINIGECRILNK